MKFINFFYRSSIYLTVALAIFHPTLQTSAMNTFSIEKIAEKEIQNGRLKNGLSFSLSPSSQLKNGLWIRISCTIPSQDNPSLVMLHQHAAFYGTEQLNREKISETLNHLGFDVDGDSSIQINQNGVSLQFSLTDSTNENVQQLLQVIKQMMLHPTLQNEEVEIARNHLLDPLKDDSIDPLSLKSTTVFEIRDFHDAWFLPNNMHLSMTGLYNRSEMIEMIAQLFESSVASLEEIPLPEMNQEDSQDNILTPFVDRIELAADNRTWIIDGKIWMTEPNWINKRSNGRVLGTVLTVLGMCGMMLTFPFAAPIAMIAGGTTIATGVYFLSGHYFKDPSYIEKIRKINLKKGFTYAYKNQQARITLTPFEMRASLMQEMMQQSPSLPTLPILVLADIYELHDPVIAEIFTEQELSLISSIKRHFIEQRNQYKQLKHLLEKELASQLAPYSLVRDTALLYAQDLYNNNRYVVAKEELNRAKKASIANIEEAYETSKISSNQREDELSQVEAYYEACMRDPELEAGLAAARFDLHLAQMGIEATYNCHVELHKQFIKYDERMEKLNLGKKSVIDYFNVELISQLSCFPIYLETLPDYLDLRFL